MIGLNRILRKLPHNEFNQRWGCGATMTLTNSDGDVYLFRRRLLQTPSFAIYLHDIERADELAALHTHPFSFASIILRGGYVENVGTPVGLKMPTVEKRTHMRGSVNWFPRGTRKAHTICWALPRTKTLVLAGPRKDTWGWFVEDEGVVPWREYLARQGRDTNRLAVPLVDAADS